MISLGRVQQLAKRFVLLSATSAAAWILHDEALKGLVQGIGRILAKIH
jgi:hypothetical protein